ncbi:MAG: S8 family peptidase [Gemmatimonadota bacterium]
MQKVSRWLCAIAAATMLVGCDAQKSESVLDPDQQLTRRSNLQEGLAPLFTSATNSPPGRPISVLRGSYVVVFQDSVQAGTDAVALTRVLERAHGFTARHSFKTVLKGFVGPLSDVAVQALRRNPRVKHIEEERLGRADDEQFLGASFGHWGLDRVDQRGALSTGDTKYRYFFGASTPHVYVIDSGIQFSATGTEFAGRVGANHYTSVTGSPTDDCDGHGTSVAGILASISYGVAKNAIVHSVKHNQCEYGLSPDAVRVGDAVDAMDWVAQNKIQPAVANMSYSFPDWYDATLAGSIEQAARNLVAAGVVFVVSAGNQNENACSRSPGDQGEVITVGAFDYSLSGPHARRPTSNFGGCVDILAPGDRIITPSYLGGSTSFSGTSGAAPSVAGVAALIRSRHSWLTPADVQDLLKESATHGALTGLLGEPDNMVYSLFTTLRITGGPTIIFYSDNYTWTATSFGGSSSSNKSFSWYLWTNGAITWSFAGSGQTYTRYVDVANGEFSLKVRMSDSITGEVLEQVRHVVIGDPGCGNGGVIC